MKINDNKISHNLKSKKINLKNIKKEQKLSEDIVTLSESSGKASFRPLDEELFKRKAEKQNKAEEKALPQKDLFLLEKPVEK